ncbi:substrate-binding domain-containing protein [uncultured Martelella sp.]|nr:substrate-binding domain-containing protein [uncultured Martelella sp.]
MGIAVPQTLSITGFDDVPMAAFTDPPLTTMSVDNAAIGRAAADYLLARLQGGELEKPGPLATTLIERQSTGPVA